MKKIQLRGQKEIPILGQGTWRMGEKASQKQLAWFSTIIGNFSRITTSQTSRKDFKLYRAASDIELTKEDLQQLDRAYKPPSRKMSLAMR